jgi:hypothetical protein
MPDIDRPSARSPIFGFWLLIGLLALFAGGKAILFDTLDPDCFWHLRVAAQLNRDGIGPIVDDLSFASSKQPWTPYSWLAELAMKSLWDHGGYRLAIAVTAILQATIVLLLTGCCLEMQRMAGKEKYLSIVIAVVIGEFLILPYLSFRPVTAGFVLLFTIAWLMLRDQRIRSNPLNSPGRKAWAVKDVPTASIWCIVPLTVLLTNMHLFSFFVPAMVLAMALGAMLQRDSRSAMRYSILAIATCIACLATPMLPGMLETIFFYSARDRMVTGPVIAEMQSIAHGPMGWITLGGLIAVLSCIVVRRRLVPTGQLICIAAATLLMLKLGRFAPLFALATCPALSACLPGLKDRLLAKPVVVLLLAVVLLIGVGRVVLAFPDRSVSLARWVNRHGPDTPGYPCAAADFVDRSVPRASDHPTGHLINEFSWGGFLAWRLEGKYQVLLDGRTQVYPQSLWQATYLGTDTDRRKFLAQIHADAALLPAGKSLFRPMLIRLGWTQVYKDDRAEVLIPPPQAGAASASSN